MQAATDPIPTLHVCTVASSPSLLCCSPVGNMNPRRSALSASQPGTPRADQSMGLLTTTLSLSANFCCSRALTLQSAETVPRDGLSVWKCYVLPKHKQLHNNLLVCSQADSKQGLCSHCAPACSFLSSSCHACSCHACSCQHHYTYSCGLGGSKRSLACCKQA